MQRVWQFIYIQDKEVQYRLSLVMNDELFREGASFLIELFHLLFNQLKNHEACPKLSLCIYSVFKLARIDLFSNYPGDRNNISSTDHTLSLLKDWIICGTARSERYLW